MSPNAPWYFLEHYCGIFGLETNSLGSANTCTLIDSRSGKSQSLYPMRRILKALHIMRDSHLVTSSTAATVVGRRRKVSARATAHLETSRPLPTNLEFARPQS